MNYYFLALLVSCCLYALLAGGWPERIVAVIYVFSCVATVIVYSPPPQRWRSLESGVFIVDVLTFVAAAAVALRADRFWPIWVSALLGVSVLGHLAPLANVIPWAYAVAISIWSYPILAILAIGTFNQHRGAKKAGHRYTNHRALNVRI